MVDIDESRLDKILSLYDKSMNGYVDIELIRNTILNFDANINDKDIDMFITTKYIEDGKLNYAAFLKIMAQSDIFISK